MKSSLLDYLFAAIFGFILAHYLIPLSKKIIQSFKDDTGFLGDFYRKYYNSIGKRLHFNRKKVSDSLKNRMYEYKIHVDNDVAKCYCSKIIDFNQNYFDEINGKIIRKGVSENYEAYFTGEVNNHYLLWIEASKDEGGRRKHHTLYELAGNKDNIVGSSIGVHQRIVTNSICILSRKNTMYNTINQLIDDTPELLKKLKNIDVSSQIII